MNVYFSVFENRHQPTFEIDKGNIIKYLEVKARTTEILNQLKKDGRFILKKVQKIDLEFIKKIHSPEYLDFLISTEKLPNGELIPDVHAFDDRLDVYALSPDLASGYFTFDDGAPFTKHTWESVIYSASASYNAAKDLLYSKKNTYALCRPPGHHATKSQAGGFCYLNNAAIAAEVLTEINKEKVLIVDIDFHHGNGTQNIFYDRQDVYYLSLHGDTNKNYPFFSGRIQEIGIHKGKGFNKNVPLPNGIGGKGYLKALSTALGQVLENFQPSYLIVSAGFDTMRNDPEGNFDLTAQDIKNVASTLAALKLPTLIVQEGGYKIKNLDKGVPMFLSEFI